MLAAKAKRLQLNLKQWRLAQVAELHPSDVSKFENGKIKLGPGQRQRLSMALGIPEFLLDQEVETIGDDGAKMA